jgi:hypothetical protein
MPQSQPPERYQNKFLRILLPLIASDWVSMVLEGWRFIRRLLSRLAQEGMYEILDYDSVLELQDPRGKVAVFKRRQKVSSFKTTSLPIRITPGATATSWPTTSAPQVCRWISIRMASATTSSFRFGRPRTGETWWSAYPPLSSRGGSRP